MRKRFLSVVCACLAATGASRAASVRGRAEGPLTGNCAVEISDMRGVWRSPQGFLPAYGDLDLVIYLASLGATRPGVAVVPVFTAEPLYFRSNRVVFVSTGLILKAESEREVTEAIRRARAAATSRDLPACAAMMPAASANFAAMKARLANQVSSYEELTARRLRRRRADVLPRSTH